MAVVTHVCVSITCDGGCPDEGWPDGVEHFRSLQGGHEQLRTDGWIVTGTRVLCPLCAAAADCAATGHRWDQWDPDVHDGIAFQVRACEHCPAAEFDPPWPQVLLLAAAARVVDGAAVQTGPAAEPATDVPDEQEH